MSLASHLEELQRKHGDIERELDEALTHPSVDDLEIVTLKRRKLASRTRLRTFDGCRRSSSSTAPAPI
jgi:hypothetical protein